MSPVPVVNGLIGTVKETSGYCWRIQKCRILCNPHACLEGTKAWETYARKSTARTLKQDRLRARSVFTAFSPSPPPNRTGYLSHHPALQFPCLFDFGLVKLALVFDNVQERFGSPHLAYLDVLSIGNLPHFALGLLFLLCARVDGSPVR
jgi:hypothetical protein